LGQTMVYYINPAGPNQPHLEPVLQPGMDLMDDLVPDEPLISAEKPIDSPQGLPREVRGPGK
ncbi:MAG TPA: hypothetical protein PLV77_06995, partial [Solirubrobacterales bacterium]|nr:hypothetical protein [Solirubrobacterales bacterium]